MGDRLDKIGGPAYEYLDHVKMFSRNANLFLVHLLLSGIGFGAGVVLFNLYLKRVGFHEGFIGTVESVTAVAAGAIALVASLFLKRLGYKHLIVVSMLVMAVSRLGQVGFVAPGLIAVFALGMGAQWGITQLIEQPFMMDHSSPRERTHLFSAQFILMVASGLVGGIIGGYLPNMVRFVAGLAAGPAAAAGSPWLLTEAAVYRWSIVLTIGFLLISLLPVLWLKEEPIPPEELPPVQAPWRAIKQRRLLVKLMTPHFVISLGAGLILPFFNLFFTKQYGATTSEVGIIYGVSALTMGLAALASPLVARRVGLLRGTMWVEIASLPFLLAIPFAPSLWWSATAYWIRGALINLSWPLFGQFAMEMLAPEERATGNGWMIVAFEAGWATSALAGGFIMARFGYVLPYYLCFGLYAAGPALIWLLLRGEDEALEARRASGVAVG